MISCRFLTVWLYSSWVRLQEQVERLISLAYTCKSLGSYMSEFPRGVSIVLIRLCISETWFLSDSIKSLRMRLRLTVSCSGTNALGESLTSEMEISFHQ